MVYFVGLCERTEGRQLAGLTKDTFKNRTLKFYVSVLLAGCCRQDGAITFGYDI